MKIVERQPAIGRKDPAIRLELDTRAIQILGKEQEPRDAALGLIGRCGRCPLTTCIEFDPSIGSIELGPITNAVADRRTYLVCRLARGRTRSHRIGKPRQRFGQTIDLLYRLIIQSADSFWSGSMKPLSCVHRAHGGVGSARSPGLPCSRVRPPPWLKYSPSVRSRLGHRDRRLA